jgi:hypothetical protein
MKTTRRRIQCIAVGLILVGSIAWVNTIASFVLTSNLIVNAELTLLFVGIGLLQENGKRTRYLLSLILLSGLVIVLIPVTAYTVSPTVTVILFGEQLTPSSSVAMGYIISMTGIYIGTLVWLVVALRRDLHFDDYAHT